MPHGPISTQVVNLKLSTSYAQFREKIDADVPEFADRLGIRGPGDLVAKPVALNGVPMLWQLPGGGQWYTKIDERNCEEVLGMIAGRLVRHIGGTI